MNVSHGAFEAWSVQAPDGQEDRTRPRSPGATSLGSSPSAAAMLSALVAVLAPLLQTATDVEGNEQGRATERM